MRFFSVGFFIISVFSMSASSMEVPPRRILEHAEKNDTQVAIFKSPEKKVVFLVELKKKEHIQNTNEFIDAYDAFLLYSRCFCYIEPEQDNNSRFVTLDIYRQKFVRGCLAMANIAIFGSIGYCTYDHLWREEPEIENNFPWVAGAFCAALISTKIHNMLPTLEDNIVESCLLQSNSNGSKDIIIFATSDRFKSLREHLDKTEGWKEQPRSFCDSYVKTTKKSKKRKKQKLAKNDTRALGSEKRIKEKDHRFTPENLEDIQRRLVELEKALEEAEKKRNEKDRQEKEEEEAIAHALVRKQQEQIRRKRSENCRFN